MSLLHKLFSRKSQTAPKTERFDAPLTPDRSFFAVGDIHGCLPLMQSLMDQMKERDPEAPIVFVGDYIDRGENSAGVLRALYELREDPNVTCLMGNHEEMMLGFLDNPIDKGARWLSFGGLQTLASFGLCGITPNASEEVLIGASKALKETMSSHLITWIRDLPSLKRFGNITVVHAGADPSKPIALQSTKTLSWGHPDFETTPRQDGTWVVHGHTIVEQPSANNGRISTDTGAYATGKLTAAYVGTGSVEFLSTGQ